MWRQSPYRNGHSFRKYQKLRVLRSPQGSPRTTFCIGRTPSNTPSARWLLLVVRASERVSQTPVYCVPRAARRAVLRCGHESDARRSGASFCARAGALGGAHSTDCRARFCVLCSRGRRPRCLLLLLRPRRHFGGAQPVGPPDSRRWISPVFREQRRIPDNRACPAED